MNSKFEERDNIR